MGKVTTRGCTKGQHDWGEGVSHLSSTAELTVFHSRQLKGLTVKAAREEAVVLLKKLDLMDKQDMFGDQLSGGMKRKLSLAISLIGGSKARNERDSVNKQGSEGSDGQGGWDE